VSQILFIHFDLVPFLAQAGSFRMLFELCAAYAAALFIGAIVNAINPS
jgi:hypothetical protein